MNKKIILLIFLTIISFFSTEKIWANKKVVYQGPIYNLFFHPLIAYPELAFSRANEHLVYMDQWFLTVNEVKKIIPELYKRGFILFSLKDLFDERKNAQGQLIITRKKLILPDGKKPLILSLDDYNFYNTMKSNGTVHRFWVNKKAKLVTVTDRDNAPPIIRDDQEVPQLLEKFISKHPDFSFNNARGIIALTGYNGIFGYNTQDFISDQLIEAKKVVRKLKKMGWEFASHSYFHLDEEKQTEQAFEKSEKRWLKEVGSIVDPTHYYVFPFGDPWNKNVVRMTFLKRMGYRYFFGVSGSDKRKIMIEPGAVVMKRYPMDGRSLRNEFSGGNVYVNPADVLDPLRLK